MALPFMEDATLRTALTPRAEPLETVVPNDALFEARNGLIAPCVVSTTRAVKSPIPGITTRYSTICMVAAGTWYRYRYHLMVH